MVSSMATLICSALSATEAFTCSAISFFIFSSILLSLLIAAILSMNVWENAATLLHSIAQPTPSNSSIYWILFLSSLCTLVGYISTLKPNESIALTVSSASHGYLSFHMTISAMMLSSCALHLRTKPMMVSPCPDRTSSGA